MATTDSPQRALHCLEKHTSIASLRSFEISISLALVGNGVGAGGVRLTVSVTPPTALPAVLAVPDAASAGTSALGFHCAA